MANSSLVNVTVWANSSNYSGSASRKKITNACLHHMAGILTAKQCGDIFARAGRGGSAHYGIGSDGKIGLYVDEKNVAWHCLPTDITEVMTPSGFVPLSLMKVGDPVFQWDIETGAITEGQVRHVVPEREEKVFRIRDTEATAEHKVAYHTYDNPELKEATWGSRLGVQTYFPDVFQYDGKGLGLTDDEIRFLVAVQADGCYLKNSDSISFHFKKTRKIERLKEILKNIGAEYREYTQGNNYKAIVSGMRYFCEQYLIDKSFSHKLFEMSPSERAIFIAELPLWDGHISDRTAYYCSTDDMSVEAVQIISMLHGINNNCTTDPARGRYKQHYRVTIPRNNKYMFDKISEVSSRNTKVSCISVDTGYIIVRQYGRVQIIGNCGNWPENQCSVGIEISNDVIGGNWHVSDKSLELTIKLVADILKRNGIKEAIKGKTVTFHSMFAQTKCPGDYVRGKMDYICAEVNKILKGGVAPAPAPVKNSFFPAKGYWGYGDYDARVGKIASFMYKTFPAYTKKAALGNWYGPNLKKAITEFQRRTGLETDGNCGPKTLAKLQQYGFKV